MKPHVEYTRFALAIIALFVGFLVYDYSRKQHLSKDGVETTATIERCVRCFYSSCYDYYFVVGFDTCRGTLRTSTTLGGVGFDKCVGRKFGVTYDPKDCSHSSLDLSQEHPAAADL